MEQFLGGRDCELLLRRLVGRGILEHVVRDTDMVGAPVLYRVTAAAIAATGHSSLEALQRYLAEELRDRWTPGRGAWVSTSLRVTPGYPWTEWGFATSNGYPISGVPDGSPTPEGLAMARFFRELGAVTAQNPGPGPDRP